MLQNVSDTEYRAEMWDTLCLKSTTFTSAIALGIYKTYSS